MNNFERTEQIIGHESLGISQDQVLDKDRVAEDEEKKSIPFIQILPLYTKKQIIDLFTQLSQIKDKTYREEGSKRAPEILNNNADYQELTQTYKRMCDAETESCHQQAQEVVNKAWRGDYGAGEWVTVHNRDEEGEYIALLKNVIPLSQWGKTELDKQKNAGKVVGIEGYYLLNPQNLEKELAKRSLDESERFDNRFAEVDPSQVYTNNQLNKEYQRLFEKYAVGKIVSINCIFTVLPKDFKPTIEVGTLFRYGGCSHHSGDIDGYLLTLPSGRFALLSEYCGEHEELFGTKKFWGVVASPKIEPCWSAKSVSWEGNRPEQPTQEEIEFMRGFSSRNQESTIANLPALPPPLLENSAEHSAKTRIISKKEIHDWICENNLFQSTSAAKIAILFGGDRLSCCDEAVAIFAKDTNKIIGIATIASGGEMRDGQPTIVGEFILPEFRRQGYGKELFEQTLNRCRELGFESVRVDIMSDGIKKIIENLSDDDKNYLKIFDQGNVLDFIPDNIKIDITKY